MWTWNCLHVSYNKKCLYHETLGGYKLCSQRPLFAIYSGVHSSVDVPILCYGGGGHPIQPWSTIWPLFLTTFTPVIAVKKCSLARGVAKHRLTGILCGLGCSSGMTMKTEYEERVCIHCCEEPRNHFILRIKHPSLRVKQTHQYQRTVLQLRNTIHAPFAPELRAAECLEVAEARRNGLSKGQRRYENGQRTLERSCSQPVLRCL